MRRAVVTGGIQFGYSRWDAANNEVEFLRIGRGSVFDYNVQVFFRIVFGEVDILCGEDAFSTLSEIAGIVDGIINGIESETSRILRERSM